VGAHGSDDLGGRSSFAPVAAATMGVDSRRPSRIEPLRVKQPPVAQEWLEVRRLKPGIERGRDNPRTARKAQQASARRRHSPKILSFGFRD
jgi:hypothetical protein